MRAFCIVYCRKLKLRIKLSFAVTLLLVDGYRQLTPSFHLDDPAATALAKMQSFDVKFRGTHQTLSSWVVFVFKAPMTSALKRSTTWSPVILLDHANVQPG